MELESFKFDFQSLNITSSRIEKFMGYGERAVPEPFPTMIREVLEEVPHYCDIRGGYRIFDNIQRDKNKHQLTIEDKTFNIHKIISYQMRKAEKAALFLCTAGKGISEWSKKLMKDGDMMKGWIVDVAGSEIVESAMDRIQDHLESEMKKKGLGITNRFSPGYCDWHVSEQPNLFSFFPDNFCGIQLSESCLMYPIKSVSGVIGIGEKAERKGYMCNFCEVENCIYRDKRKEISC